MTRNKIHREKIEKLEEKKQRIVRSSTEVDTIKGLISKVYSNRTCEWLLS